MSQNIGRPAENEYLSYFGPYISLVGGDNILKILDDQIGETLTLLRQIPESQADFRYQPDKWSIKELVGHLIDSERIFAYRALRFARNDKTALPGYEQDDYVRNGSFNDCSLAELAAEMESVRRSNLLLFRHLEPEAWTRTGIANDSEASVRAIAYIIAGHELHHREILRTRYLAATR